MELVGVEVEGRGGDRVRNPGRMDPSCASPSPFRSPPFTPQIEMAIARSRTSKKNLLLCFDAFGTLFTPTVPVPAAYARAATRYGIDCGDTTHGKAVAASFKQAFKAESRANPNYGKAVNLGAEKWWGNVSLTITQPKTSANQAR
jgi:hypothetical protein